MARHVFELLAHGETHVGRVREINEDHFLVGVASGVFAVADGMGGHDAGEIASAVIVERLKSIGRPASALDLQARFEDRVDQANAEIRTVAEERGRGSMGSTLAALLVFETQFACLWSGDSRIYQLRRGRLAQLTRDHSEVQELLDGGMLTEEEARHWPRRNIITHAIGVAEAPFLDIVHGTIEDGDRFLICSDGLTAHVEAEEIGEALAADEPEAACRRLVELTLERGATDNVTVVAVAFREAAAGAPAAREAPP